MQERLTDEELTALEDESRQIIQILKLTSQQHAWTKEASDSSVVKEKQAQAAFAELRLHREREPAVRELMRACSKRNLPMPECGETHCEECASHRNAAITAALADPRLKGLGE